MREIGPDLITSPRLVCSESLLTQLSPIRMEDRERGEAAACSTTSWSSARRVGSRILDVKPVGPAESPASYWLAGCSSTGPLKNSLGMSRVRIAYTAGEAIGPDLFVFYRSLGHQSEAALRLDRDLRHGLRAAQRRGEARHRSARR
jgi:long-chain acyl-CoA synthetase